MSAPEYGAYGQNLRSRVFDFSCATVTLCDGLMKQDAAGRVLAPQLLRCATSIGANLEEARAGESRRDFISKCSIALKEARETHYRLRVLQRCQLGREDAIAALVKESGELAAILGAIVRNARRQLTIDKEQFTKRDL